MMMMMSSWCVLAASIGTVLAIPPWAYPLPPPIGAYPPPPPIREVPLPPMMGAYPPPPPMDGSPIPALPYPPPPFQGGRRPRPPPGFDQLPEDVRAKLTAIHENRTMEWREKQAQIDAIMQSLPASIRDKLPPPPGFALLPREVQTEYKSIMSNKSLNWEQRHNQIRQLLEKLPADIKSKMPPPPMPPAFEMLPASIRSQLRAIHENRELGFRERYQKIKEVIDQLPDDIKSKLPQPPPPPPMFQ